MSSRMTPERATIRAVVRTAVHGQAVTCCVCQCGTLLLGNPNDGIRCSYEHCQAWYSAAEIAAAIATYAPPQQDAA